MADGNNAAMREAVGNALWCLNWMDENTSNEVIKDHLAKPIELLTAALAVPPRNCDVGTAKEQYVRFNRYCKARYKNDKPNPCGQADMASNPCAKCYSMWVQMPYEGKA